MKRSILFSVFILITFSPVIKAHEENDEAAAKEFLAEYDRRASELFYYDNVVTWAYYTNITDENEAKMAESSLKIALYNKELVKNCSKIHWEHLKNATMVRQFKGICKLGTSALPEEEIKELKQLVYDMENIYSTGKVCDGGKCQELEPDLTRLFAKSRDYNKLKKAWHGWRDASGRKIKEMYKRFVELTNKAAKLNGYKDNGDSWRDDYETEDFEERIEKLWNTVKPLYQQLHTFVRKRLREVYKGNEFPAEGHIPAHLLGNMWAQSWINIFELVKPYPKASAVNVTAALMKKGLNATDIVRMADEFFVSMGLLPVPQLFWEKSMFVKPEDGRDVICHASAWDFYDSKDFRLKQCTDITQEYLEVSHHEMGHIQYFLQYKDQPVVFRDGANHGFHEAVGDIISLSVMTPEHLHKVGLLENVDPQEEADLNFLMRIALDKIAFLPFGFLIDQWRWSVFRGDTEPDSYNSEWWKLRCKYQGLAPPVTRSEDDFDPGAKYHIPANVPYIRYFVSFILQFQFHKKLCEISGNTRQLHRCDLYQSKDAGTALANMLKLGSSVPWPQALKQVTGTENMDAQAMVEYFKPLYEWLKKENQGEEVGWDEKCPPESIIQPSSAVKGFPRIDLMLVLLFVSAMMLIS